MTHRKLVLGKVDYIGTGRKVNKVVIEWELTPDGRFSATGEVWNSSGTDILSGGQNLDEIARLFPRDDRVQRIVRVWRDWHLNDMRAGTVKQERAVKTWLAEGNPYDYGRVVKHLKDLDLYEDNGYKYGAAWIKEELPDEVRAEIQSWDDFPQGDQGTGRIDRRAATRRFIRRTQKTYETPTNVRRLGR